MSISGDHIDQRLLDMALPECLQAVFDVVSPTVMGVFMSTPVTRRMVEVEIAEAIGPMPPLPAAERDVLTEVLFLPAAPLQALTRIVSVLLNNASLQSMTRASELAPVIEFCGTQKVIDVLRTQRPQVPEWIPTPPALTAELMPLHDKVTMSFLLGLFPAAHQTCFALRFPPDSLPAATKMPADCGDRALLVAHCASALNLLPHVESLDATDQAA